MINLSFNYLKNIYVVTYKRTCEQVNVICDGLRIDKHKKQEI